MAVPKKRTSKAKKNSRKANWKRKAAKSAKNLYH
jgi:large subunit ribosomal protein L32